MAVLIGTMPGTTCVVDGVSGRSVIAGRLRAERRGIVAQRVRQRPAFPDTRPRQMAVDYRAKIRERWLAVLAIAFRCEKWCVVSGWRITFNHTGVWRNGMSRMNRRRFTWMATGGVASAALVACGGDAVEDDPVSYTHLT